MPWVHFGRAAHQIVLAMFGLQHRRHLLEVGGVAAFLGAGGETDRDDPLCDVDQVHLIAVLHGLNHTLTPGEAERTRGVNLVLPYLSRRIGWAVHPSSTKFRINLWWWASAQLSWMLPAKGSFCATVYHYNKCISFSAIVCLQDGHTVFSPVISNQTAPPIMKGAFAQMAGFTLKLKHLMWVCNSLNYNNAFLEIKSNGIHDLKACHYPIYLQIYLFGNKRGKRNEMSFKC